MSTAYHEENQTDSTKHIRLCGSLTACSLASATSYVVSYIVPLKALHKNFFNGDLWKSDRQIPETDLSPKFSQLKPWILLGLRNISKEVISYVTPERTLQISSNAFEFSDICKTCQSKLDLLYFVSNIIEVSTVLI